VQRKGEGGPPPEEGGASEEEGRGGDFSESFLNLAKKGGKKKVQSFLEESRFKRHLWGGFYEQKGQT